jgi:hypothetical protein
MKRNTITLAVMLVVSICSMNVDCYNRADSTDFHPIDYKFEIPVKITELKKTYALADTIWIETNQTAKTLYDVMSNSLVTADTGFITFGASFNEFGTAITNPPNGFCDVLSPAGLNVGKDNGYWGTSVRYEYGCGQPDYKVRLGFLPHYRGTFYLSLLEQDYLQACPQKHIRYYAQMAYKYEAPDIGLDIFNSLPDNLQGGNGGRDFYRKGIADKEIFVFQVN